MKKAIILSVLTVIIIFNMIFITPFLFLKNKFLELMRYSLLHLPEKARHILNMYDAAGLKYHVNHLENIFPEIIFWSTEEQSKYADQTTIENVQHGNEYVLNMHVLFPEQVASMNINATSIGNAAYVLLHSKDEMIKGNAGHNLDIIKDYYQSLKDGGVI